MDKKSEGWIHNFNVTDTLKNKGYTIYKITSIVFPRYIPEALSCVTLWKRFSDIKKLYKEINKKHKNFHLPGNVPEIVESSFFNRFDPVVIEERKAYILKLLNYIADHSILYKSQAFSKFFESGISPDGSPEKNSNIASICADLSIPIQPDIILIDPTRDSSDEVSVAESNPIADDSMMDSLISLSDESTTTIKSYSDQIINEDNDEVDAAPKEPENEADYVFEAAMEFSKAVEAEVNNDYKVAFDNYKSGIDRLLTGAKNDENIFRKKMAKEKTCKYLKKAEEIYAKYVANQEENEILEISETVDDRSSVKLLERQINYLSRYKVVKILDNLMQVQDVTDKKFYVMKAIQKPSSNCLYQTVFLPQNVLYMVPLIAYFQSEATIFLLLKLVCGGKLWSYICTYSRSSTITCDAVNDDEGQKEIEDEPRLLEPVLIDEIQSAYDSRFINLLTEYNQSETKLETENGETVDDVDNAIERNVSSDSTQQLYIPSFDTLSKDMDVNDLVCCSQQLLNSVSQTLEESKALPQTDVQKVLKETVIEDCPPNTSQFNTNSSQLVLVNSMICSSSSLESKLVVNADLLPEGCVRRWASELIISVDSLHYNGIICGDLTMDNVLLGSEGHIMLTYFYRKDKNHNTPVNSPKQEAVEKSYVAPERPLTQKSDWWSVGVILFEMLTKKRFITCHPAYVSCYYEVQYPEVDISDGAKDLLDGLLQFDPENRFDFKTIIGHTFFQNIDWNDVRSKGRM